MSEPATPVTVTLPADWRDQLDRAFAQAPHFQGAIGLVRQVVESWAAPVVSGDVEAVRQQHECDATLVAEYHKAYATIAKRTAERDKLSDSLKLAIAAADRRQARIDSALALVEQYLTGHWPNSGVRALFLAALSNDPAARVPVDPETTQPATEPLHWRTEDGGIAAVFCGTCNMLGGHEPDCAAGATQDGDQT